MCQPGKSEINFIFLIEYKFSISVDYTLLSYKQEKMKLIELEKQRYWAELTKTYRTLDVKLKNLKRRSPQRNSNQKLYSEVFSLTRQVMDITTRWVQTEKNYTSRLDDLKKMNVS